MGITINRDIIPNLLSFLRLALLVPILYFLNQDTLFSICTAIVLFSIAGLTDFLDGYLARKWNTISTTGRILDPLADKLLAGGVALYLVVVGKFPVWYCLLIIGRDIIILISGLLLWKKTEIVASSNFIGKITFTIIVFSLLAAILDIHYWELILAPVGALFILISLILYGISGFRKVKGNG